MTAPQVASRRKTLVKFAIMVAGLVAGGLLLRVIGAALGTDWVDAHIRDSGLRGQAVFLLLGTALTAAGAPRQGIAFLGGYAFGAAIGTALALLAQLAGCALSFGWARLIGRVWAERRMTGRFGHRLRPLREALVENPFSATLALRLLPIGNNLALNLLAGMVGIALLPFLMASAIGYLPQTVVFALLGKGIRVDGAWQMALATGLLAASIGIGFWLIRRHRAGRALED
jgi:uncharacterized membrane protein YdjX (TVP38/TMEM64 family)